ncbi:hypothetical protein BGZ76_006590 [Entomortierella beljakovae]|nr:hypothetical protein BGZ76_006590 [Entomortierella beljakovae]
MAHPEARMDAITFDYDLTINHEFQWPQKTTQDIEIEITRSNKSRSLAVELGWATQSSIELKNSYSDNELSPQVFTPAVHDERRRQITLNESLAKDQSLEFSDRFNFNVLDDDLVGEDLGLYIDSDGNLVDYMPALQIEDSGNISLVPQTLDILESLGKHNRNEELPVVDDDPNEHGLLNLDIDHNQLLPVPIIQRCLSNEVKKAKNSRLIIDDHTMLPNEDILESWENFHSSQTNLIRERKIKQAAISARVYIEKSMSRPICILSSNPVLNRFWEIAGARTLTGLRVTKHSGEPLPFNQDNQAEFLNGVEQNTESFFDPPEPEQVRRRHMSADTAVTPVDLGGGGAFGPGSVESSRLGSHMPWSVSLRANFSGHSEHSATSSDHLRRDFEAVFDREFGRMSQRQRAVMSTEPDIQDFDGIDDGSSARRQRAWHGHSRSHVGSRDSSRQRFTNRVDDVGSSSASLYDSERDLYVPDLTQNPNREHLVIERETVNFMDSFHTGQDAPDSGRAIPRHPSGASVVDKA